MTSRLMDVGVQALLVAAVALPLVSAVARADDQAPDTDGRKPFAGARSPEERHPLLDAWRARHDQTHQSSGAALSRSPLAVGGTPIVGRASMVINSSNSVVYTKNFLTLENNCDIDSGYAQDWKATTAYVTRDHVRKVRSGNTNFMATNSGTSGAVEPVWNLIFGATTTDGTITWICTGGRWTASRAYTVGMSVIPASQTVGFTYQATTGGTSGLTEPLFPTTIGGTVSDGGVVWKAIGFFPGSFKGCNPMQLVSRASGGAETLIASEGDPVGGGGMQLSGWGEFIAMNASGVVSFRAAVQGILTDNDETGSGIFLAGPGAGALTKIATSGDTIGGRYTCGFSTMVGMNDAGQVVFDGLTIAPGAAWLANHAYQINNIVTPAPPNGLQYIATNAGTSGGSQPAFPTSLNATIVDGAITWKTQVAGFGGVKCDENSHGLVRFTPGPGNELLVTLGSSVGGSTVVGFGNDADNATSNSAGGGSNCTTCTYNDIDGLINSAGHVPVVLRLADATQGVYNFSAPGVSTQVARTGGANPYTALSPRASVNNVDQVAFKGGSGGISRLFRFTPPATTVTVASVGDDLGVRGGGPASGVTFASFGNFVDLNNLGNLVFQAKLSGVQEGFYYWDGSTGLIKEVFRKADTNSLAPEMITLNDANQVAYVTGSKTEGATEDHSAGHETGGAFFWKAGSTQKAIGVGDVVGGNTVNGLYAQHQSFVRRQLNSVSCLATAYTVATDDTEMDCSEGDPSATCHTKSPLLFISCATSGPAIPLSVPIVLSSAGLNGSFFTSELALTNRGSSDASINYIYTAAFGGSSGTAADNLAAGRQKIVPDAIAYLRALGIPLGDSGNRGGTLRVSFSGLSSTDAAAATVRTTTAVPEGRAGLAYAGLGPQKLISGAAYICGLRQNLFDRSNVALINAGSSTDGDVTLRLTVISGDPGNPRTQALPDVTLSPGGFNQISGILASNGLNLTNGYVKVERVSGTAPFYAYGVINDQANSDGSFVEPVPASPSAAITGATLPVVVETSAFSTELVVTNFFGNPRTLTCTYVASALSGGQVAFNLTLLPNEQQILPAFVQVLRSRGVISGGPGATFAGALFVSDASGDLRGVSVGARTSAPGGGGRYGLFYSAVPNGAEATSVAWLYGLQQNADNRTNLALVNVGSIDGGADTFHIDLYDGATGQKAGETDATVAAKGFFQINTILAAFAPGVASGYARVTRTSGNNPFVTYAVINDGGQPGQRSGDGAFVSAALPGS